MLFWCSHIINYQYQASSYHNMYNNNKYIQWCKCIQELYIWKANVYQRYLRTKKKISHARLFYWATTQRIKNMLVGWHTGRAAAQPCSTSEHAAYEKWVNCHTLAMDALQVLAPSKFIHTHPYTSVCTNAHTLLLSFEICYIRKQLQQHNINISSQWQMETSDILPEIKPKKLQYKWKQTIIKYSCKEKEN